MDKHMENDMEAGDSRATFSEKASKRLGVICYNP